MNMETISLATHKKEVFINITSLLSKILEDKKISNGIMTVFVPHTTAGITINEAADEDVVRDITTFLNKCVPNNDTYRHSEGNSPAHIKALITGSSVSIPIMDGKMKLGTWQGVFFCEFDGPRNRKLYVTL